MSIRTKTQTAVSVWRNFGAAEVLRIPFRKFASRNSGGPTNETPRGGYKDLVLFTAPNHEFLAACGRFQKDAERINSYTEYLKDFSSRTKKPRNGFFGEIYDLGAGLGFVLFDLIETEKPQKVIETGVAAGASSNLILDRLSTNGTGVLISVDITSKVGELVDERLKNRWTISVLPKLFKKKAFLRILSSHPDAIIFLHDSDHSIQWQIFEISSVIKSIPGVKHILVDDVTLEFENYVLTNLPNWKMVVIDEGRKLSGYLSRKN
jgi:hypothetical protein